MKLLYVLNLKHPTYDESMLRIHAEYMGKKHEVYWVMPSSKQFKKKQQRWRNANIFLTGRSRKGFASKLINYFFTPFLKFGISRRIIKEKGVEIIVARNDVLDGILCLILARKYDLKYVFRYSFPVYEDMIISAKKGKGEFPKVFSYVFGFVANKVVHWIMNKSDCVVAMSDAMEKDIRKKGIKSRILVIPCGSRVLDPLPSGEKIRKKYGLGFPTLIYIGSLYKLKGIDIVIEVFRMLKENGSKFFGLIAGSGSGKEELERRVEKYGLKNYVFFTGKYGVDEGEEIICAADIGISPYPELPVYKSASPAKLMAYLGCGKPVVGSKIPDQELVIEKSGGGISVEHKSEEFVKAVTWMIKNKKKAEQMGKNGREWVSENRTYMINGKKYEEMCESLLKE